MAPRLLPRVLRLLLMALPFSGQAQLNGTYLIDGGGGGDYLTFTAAVTDLTTLGIAGPVVFDVADGTYTEQISIPAITGSSAANTITFRGQSLDSSLVSLEFGSLAVTGPPNEVVGLYGVAYIRFEHMTLQRPGSLAFGGVIRIGSTSRDWHFNNCRLWASNSSGNSDVLRHIGSFSDIGNSSVTHCDIQHGGATFNSVSAGSFTLANNDIDAQGTFALDLNNFDAEVQCLDNNIVSPSYFANSINLNGCDPTTAVIARNSITCNAPSSEGIRLANTTGTALNPIMVANNMIICNGSMNTSIGIWLVGTTQHVDI
ncbi:MAG TPA: hypothetical protein PLL57_15735, partial [Flavobacteriales bacterium]|nr:hypothetical protein [Flavobacteriales bacterium]